MKLDKVIEKIINYLLNILIIIFGIVLLISIYNGIQSKILKKKYVDFFGYSMFEVQTGSMADTINAGDWIIVKLTKNVHIRDIITYELNGEYITHRIISSYGNHYITMGDANNAKDDPVKQNQIVGKVVKILPSLGILRKVILNPSVLIALIITLFLFNYSFKKVKDTDKKIYQIIFEKIKKIFSRSKSENKNLEEKKKVKDNKNSDAPKIEKIDQNEKGIFYDFSDISDEIETEDELDKTTLFRVIPVDASEIDNTFLEIAETEIKESDSNEKKEKEESQDSPEENQPEENRMTKINFELLKDNKKGKNIIDTVMIYKIEELEEIIETVIDNQTYLNKKTIKNLFMSIYIDARYYDYYGDKDIEGSNKNLLSKIEEMIKITSKETAANYKGDDEKYKETVLAYEKLFILIANLEQARNFITDMKVKKKFYKKEILRYTKNKGSQRIDNVIDKIIQVQRNYAGITEYFLKKLGTGAFELRFSELSTKKNMYVLELEHNISFSKVYSDYIIDKTYREGIIAEDKMPILFTLLLIQLINDMETANFNKKYIINIPHSLYSKEKKLERFLKMIGDRYAKENIIILITFEDLSNSKSFIKDIRRMGYKFALAFNKETDSEEKKLSDLYVADYIFLDKKFPNALKILSFIPDDLLDNVIYEDINNKVGELGDQS